MQNYEGLTLKYVNNPSKLIRTHTQPSRKMEGTRRQKKKKTLLYVHVKGCAIALMARKRKIRATMRVI